ncbi:MAG: hypothetical protein R6U37_07125, partial [Dehalococcoidia bacterium]
ENMTPMEAARKIMAIVRLSAMNKKRKTFSLDDHVVEYLKRDEINASGLVNRLVIMYMRGEVDL